MAIGYMENAKRIELPESQKQVIRRHSPRQQANDIILSKEEANKKQLLKGKNYETQQKQPKTRKKLDCISF